MVTLYGIDAPATGQAFSAEAENKLHTMLLNKKVTVCPQKMMGGNAAEVYVLSGYKLNVNEEMVRKGLAWSTVARYKNLETLARKKRQGLWSARQSNAAARVPQEGSNAAHSRAAKYSALWRTAGQLHHPAVSVYTRAGLGLTAQRTMPHRKKTPQSACSDRWSLKNFVRNNSSAIVMTV